MMSARRDWERSVRVMMRVVGMWVWGVEKMGSGKVVGDDERKRVKRVGIK